MEIAIPDQLAFACEDNNDRARWLSEVPHTVGFLAERWALTIGSPFDGRDVSCAWVAPAVREGGIPAVLKLGMPHMEGRDEIAGLRFWNGDPTVRVLEADETRNAVLLERCRPGTALRQLPEYEQDAILAGLLRRMWRRPPDPNRFRPLEDMIRFWIDEADASSDDTGLSAAVVRILNELARPTESDVVLGTDIHAGNVLMAEREPWLVIDPKPFVGDPAYDATQHSLNCRDRLAADPIGTIERFSDLLDVDAKRVRLWTFGRLGLESLTGSTNAITRDLVRRLAP